MAKVCLAIIHSGHRRSEGLHQSETQSSVQYMTQGYPHKIKSDSLGLEYPAWSVCVCVGMWQGHIDKGLRIALFMLRWSKILSAVSLACCWCTGFGSTLPLVEKLRLLCGVSWVLFFFSFSQLFEQCFFLFFKILLYMYEEGIVHPCVQWTFLWRTSVGSKPCSDSCLVNHLIKFSNRVPTSEV